MNPWKFSISLRIFLATFTATVLMAMVGLELARWTLFDNFSAGSQSRDGEWRELAPLQQVLGERYRSAGGWSFLPMGEAARKSWLRDALAEGDAIGAAGAGNSDAHAHRSPTLGQRIALLDADQRYLAGIDPAPFLVAFASIDTLVRPLRVQGQTVGYLQIATAAHAEDELAVAFLMDRQARLPWLALFATLAIALVSAFLAARFRKPIRQLVSGARRLEEGQYDARLDSGRSDEFGELARAFDQLAARLQSLRDEQRRWVAHASHELRTPLAVLQAQIEALDDGVRQATPEHVQLMSRQTDALTRIVDDLHVLAMADAGKLDLERRSCALWPLVVDAVQAFAPRMREAGLAAEIVQVPVQSTVCGDDGRLCQVIDNLLENCIRHTEAGGCIEIGGHVVANSLHLIIDDSAPGVAVEQLPRLGERFFRIDASRTRRPGAGGSGLGLALCRQIIEAHAGTMEFAMSPLGGLRVQLILPLEA